MNKSVFCVCVFALATIASPRSKALAGERQDGEALDGEVLGGEALDGEALDREALGAEALGCYVNVGLPGVYKTPRCFASRAMASYDVPFQVLNESGTYTFAWTTSGGSVVSGCTSTSDFCILHVQALSFDQIVSASVSLMQGGQQRTISAQARISAVCAGPRGLVFC